MSLMRYLVLSELVSLLPEAYPSAPKFHITQYSHTAWRMQDGVFSGSPQKIAQMQDGYLWIGTANGPLRFDGVRFAPWGDLSGHRELAAANILLCSGRAMAVYGSRGIPLLPLERSATDTILIERRVCEFDCGSTR
jgi:ligand-binding sensor domain-containing protein